MALLGDGGAGDDRCRGHRPVVDGRARRPLPLGQGQDEQIGGRREFRIEGILLCPGGVSATSTSPQVPANVADGDGALGSFAAEVEAVSVVSEASSLAGAMAHPHARRGTSHITSEQTSKSAQGSSATRHQTAGSAVPPARHSGVRQWGRGRAGRAL